MSVQFFLCANSKGQLRLLRWFTPRLEDIERKSTVSNVCELINEHAFSIKHSRHFVRTLETGDQIVVKKYNGLYFVLGLTDNEDRLLYLQSIPLFVEILDQMFNNVCELDMVYNFPQMYKVLDLLYGGGNLGVVDQQRVLEEVQNGLNVIG